MDPSGPPTFLKNQPDGLVFLLLSYIDKLVKFVIMSISLENNKERRIPMRILIIDAKGSLRFKAMMGVDVLCMKSINENDLPTIAKLNPDAVFLAFHFSGYEVKGLCLQGPQILPLLWKYVPGVPVIGLGNWGSLDEAIQKHDLSGLETQERFEELFKEFLI